MDSAQTFREGLCRQGCHCVTSCCKDAFTEGKTYNKSLTTEHFPPRTPASFAEMHLLQGERCAHVGEQHRLTTARHHAEPLCRWRNGPAPARCAGSVRRAEAQARRGRWERAEADTASPCACACSHGRRGGLWSRGEHSGVAGRNRSWIWRAGSD